MLNASPTLLTTMTRVKALPGTHHQQDELRRQPDGQSRLVAYNAETDTKKFTDVKGFVSVEEAAKGVHHADIPNGTPLDAVNPMPANDNDLWLLRIQDLDMVRYAGSDQLGQQKARELVQQGGNRILVRRKHIKVESMVMAYNAETDTKKFTDVKGFLSVDQVARGVHHVDVPNWTPLDPVGPLSNNDNDYCMVKIQDLDTVSYAGSDELGRQRAREAVQRNGNQIVIKRKHLKVNLTGQDSGAVAAQLPATGPASHLAAQPPGIPAGTAATQLPSLPKPAAGAAQLPSLPATGPASALMPQLNVPGAAPAQAQAAAPAQTQAASPAQTQAAVPVRPATEATAPVRPVPEATQLPGLPATGPASALMPQLNLPGAAPAQTQAAAPVRPAREAAAPARPATQAAANGMPVAQNGGQALCEICGKPTWDGNPGACSKVCLAKLEERRNPASVQPAAGPHLCPTCQHPTWDGNPGYCSVDHQEAHKRQLAGVKNYCPCGLLSWDGNPGYCCLDHQAQYGPR